MKILMALLGVFVLTGAFADQVDVTSAVDATTEESAEVFDEASVDEIDTEQVEVQEDNTEKVPSKVTERLTCPQIQAKITELSGLDEPDTETVDELTKYKAEYRKSCTRAAAARRTAAGTRVIVNVVKPAVKEDTQQEKKAEVKKADEAETEVDPMVALEQELANLDAGLCADGSKPNKFGCCGDEIFKDLGNTVFACCPRDGVGDCFPPIK